MSPFGTNRTSRARLAMSVDWVPAQRVDATQASQQKHLTPCSSNQILMGMGSPDNRRKADGSYQTQGVGRGFFCPSFARKRQTMAGLPVSLIVASWLVVTTWIVGIIAYWFETRP
jgi:hypothetical protein